MVKRTKYNLNLVSYSDSMFILKGYHLRASAGSVATPP